MDRPSPRRQPLLRGYLLIALGASVLIGVPLALLILLGAMQATTRTAAFGPLEWWLVTALVIASSGWATARFQNGKRLVAAAQDERAFDEHADFILYLRGFLDDIVASQTLGEPTISPSAARVRTCPSWAPPVAMLMRRAGRSAYGK